MIRLVSLLFRGIGALTILIIWILGLSGGLPPT